GWLIHCAQKGSMKNLPTRRSNPLPAAAPADGSSRVTSRLLRAPLLLAALLAQPILAQQIGEVDTVFNWIGPDHKIVVDAHDDPKVGGVTCCVSRAETSGRNGAVCV